MSSPDLDRNCESYFHNKATTEKSRENVKRLFAQLYSRATPGEIRWIARIILKGEAYSHDFFVASLTHDRSHHLRQGDNYPFRLPPRCLGCIQLVL
jgi:hypothetical protein